MKKLIFVLCLVLGCTFASAAGAQDAVRVGLNTSAASADFGSEYGLNFYNAVTGDVLYTSSPGESVTLLPSGSGYRADGKFSAENVEKLSIQSVNKTPITYNKSAYRGYFLLERSGGSLSVVNIVAMNQYLYSVLGREMSPSFPLEALKAQAICAKNFVLGESGRHSGYDVCATTHCQVYSGVSGEAERTIAAVDAVGDKVASYNGKIVPLYFFATSGGMTEDVANVWGSSIPYLVSVSDPFEPADRASRYTWTTTLTGDDIGSRLASRGHKIGAVTGIVVNETSASGRVTKLTFTGTDGTVTLSRESCRTAIGTDVIYSQCFTVSGNGPSGGVVATGGALGGGRVLTANGIQDMAGKTILSAAGLSEFSSGTATGTNFTFNGRGYGHGVGMSQWGALGMAEQGYGYEDILKHYFTGIEIR